MLLVVLMLHVVLCCSCWCGLACTTPSAWGWHSSSMPPPGSAPPGRPCLCSWMRTPGVCTADCAVVVHCHASWRSMPCRLGYNVVDM